MAGEIPKSIIEFYDERIRNDYKALANMRAAGIRGRNLVYNQKNGYRHGNIVADFIGMLHTRLLEKDAVIEIDPHDPESAKEANNAEIVARSLVEILGLRNVMKKATADAAWAPFGVIEIGHPLSSWTNDLSRSKRSYNMTEVDKFDTADDWVVADPAELASIGIQPEDVREGDMQSFERTPAPIFDTNYDYPWVTDVHPFLIVMPPCCSSPDRAPYITRLRFITAAELKIAQNVTIDEKLYNASQYKDLWEQTAEDGSIDQFPGMLLIAETYIKYDRNNPEYNGWYFCHVVGYPEAVITSGPKPDGGMIPLEFVTLSDIKPAFGTPLARELEPFADIYDSSVKSLMREMEEMINRPIVATPSAVADPKTKKQLENKNYKGIIISQEPDGIKKLWADHRVDNDLMRAMIFIKSLAQARSSVSDIDQGIAVKDISASQSRALLDATGRNIVGMSALISKATRRVVIKLMHLVGIYSTAAAPRKYKYGARFATIDKGVHDFVSSLIYTVRVADSLDEMTNEERLIWIQYLRTVGGDPELKAQYDIRWLAQETNKRFGVSQQGLRTEETIAREKAIAQQNALQQQLLGGGVDGSMQGGVNPLVEGQHPEREAGSRGVDLTNLASGMMRTGMGTGEQ